MVAKKTPLKKDVSESEVLKQFSKNYVEKVGYGHKRVLLKMMATPEGRAAIKKVIADEMADMGELLSKKDYIKALQLLDMYEVDLYNKVFDPSQKKSAQLLKEIKQLEKLQLIESTDDETEYKITLKFQYLLEAMRTYEDMYGIQDSFTDDLFNNRI